MRMCREMINTPPNKSCDMMCRDALTVVLRFLLNDEPRAASKGAAGVEDGLENSSVVCRSHPASVWRGTFRKTA